MRKIINGKRYDTETAAMLASYDNGGGWRDFRHYEEEIYRKKTGEYFLHGEGGPMTGYAQPESGGSWTGGENIRPINEEEAKEWVESYANDAYEEIFGEVEE